MFSRWSIPFVCTLLVLAGCGKENAPQSAAAPAKAESIPGGVCVVDLDVVAKRLGRDIEMQESVDERLRLLNKKLTTLQTSLRRLYDEKKEQFGDDPTEEQLAELRGTEERHTQQLLELKRKSEIDLASFREELIGNFREEAKPYLREIAASRGLSIVIPKNGALLLSIDPKAEITDEVASKMPKSASEKFDEPASEQPARKSKKRQPSTETSSR